MRHSRALVVAIAFTHNMYCKLSFHYDISGVLSLKITCEDHSSYVLILSMEALPQYHDWETRRWY